MAAELTPLERDVIGCLLTLEHPVTDALRRQVEHCRVASREVTGVGFFANLDVDARIPPAPVKPGAMRLGDVTATIEGLQRGAGFVLSVQDGVLHALEGFSYDEPWPDAIAGYEATAGGVTHGPGSRTDPEAIEAAWDGSGYVGGR